MENKLNKSALEVYAKQASKQLCTQFFSISKNSISGDEILSFTDIKQVNYFVLKEIYFLWKQEIAKLKQSKFFDYTHPEVELSLENLMKTASNHILVQRVEFESLLASAIEETIYLALSPYHYFKTYFFTTDIQKISLADIKTKSKYVKLNDTFFNHFIEKLEVYKVSVFYVSDIMGYFQEAYYNTNDKFEDYEPILAKFSKILPVPLSEIVTDAKKKDDYAPTPLEVFEKQNLDKKEDLNKMIPHAALKPLRLGLNERVMFTKELFDNDNQLFNATIARLEASGNWQNAKTIIDYLKLDTENEVVQEFYELIEARFKI